MRSTRNGQSYQALKLEQYRLVKVARVWEQSRRGSIRLITLRYTLMYIPKQGQYNYYSLHVVCSLGDEVLMKYFTISTQDFIVNNVRRTLFDTVSSFSGCTDNEEDLGRLIQEEFEVLQKVFHLPLETTECNFDRVAMKLLNLYRTGRLGHYTLDHVPCD